jgi:prevent-host-death family protein
MRFSLTLSIAPSAASHHHDHNGQWMSRRDMPEKAAVWSVAEAKARLSEVIDRALKEGPQSITRNGRPAVVVVSSTEWTRKAERKGTLAEFFAASPLPDSALDIERPQDDGREIEL